MNIFESIVLGVVQGITEFLPISSTGHLILAREFLGIGDVNGLAFDVVLHFATALAIAIYFRADIMSLVKQLFSSPVNYIKEHRTIFLTYILAGIPVVIVGLFAETYIESFFRSSTSVALTLIFGGILFIIAELISRRNQNKSTSVSLKQGVIIGLVQVLALIPGMSRSGSTISAGLLSGTTRTAVARFSFLLALPLLFGVGIKKMLDLSGGEQAFAYTPLIVASITAFFVGYISLSWLMKILSKNSLIPFALYRFALAVYILAFFQ
ncbi:MAG: undecaprenyl-diphosphatase UppP [Candidatus Paceibacterota bacterium]